MTGWSAALGLLSSAAILALLASPALAGEADVVDVVVRCTKAEAKRVCAFSVTLRHADDGWDHYADRWEILSAEEKEIIATRVLRHPHVDEQPFTRRLQGIVLDPEVEKVRVRGHDKVHGHGGVEKIVVLPPVPPT